MFLLGAVAVYSRNAKFGNSTGPIWLKEILCFGNEVDILHCLSDPDTQNCDHSLDIGVICAIGGKISATSSVHIDYYTWKQ